MILWNCCAVLFFVCFVSAFCGMFVSIVCVGLGKVACCVASGGVLLCVGYVLSCPVGLMWYLVSHRLVRSFRLFICWFIDLFALFCSFVGWFIVAFFCCVIVAVCEQAATIKFYCCCTRGMIASAASATDFFCRWFVGAGLACWWPLCMYVCMSVRAWECGELPSWRCRAFSTNKCYNLLVEARAHHVPRIKKNPRTTLVSVVATNLLYSHYMLRVLVKCIVALAISSTRSTGSTHYS